MGYIGVGDIQGWVGYVGAGVSGSCKVGWVI